MAASKFTPERRAAAVEHFAGGMSVPAVAELIEVRVPTLKSWLTRGRREEGTVHADFARAVAAARQAAEDRDEPMDEDELRRVVSRSARKGNVQAQKLYWEMIRADRDEVTQTEEPEGFDALDEGDELAQARARKASA